MTSRTRPASGALQHQVIDKGEVDLVMAYIEEIEKFPVLDDVEALQLGREKHAGELAEWYRADWSKLSEPERSDRVSIATNGRLARTRLTEASLRLVVSIARRYQGQGLGMLALIEAGNRGLVRAIDKFDGTTDQFARWNPAATPEDEFTEGSFSRFASSWIRASIHRALDVAGFVAGLPRIPRSGEVENNPDARKLHDLLEELPGRLGREPTVEEVAKELGFTEERARRYASTMIATLDMDPTEEDMERGGRY